MRSSQIGQPRRVGGTVALIALVLSSGCSREKQETDAAIAALRDGSAKAALQRYFDKRRECAPVLAFNSRARLLHAEKADAGAQALVAVGLIEPVPGHRRPDRSFYRPAAAARQWFAFQNPAAPAEPQLCFGRRSVRDMTLDLGNGRPGYRYSFNIIDPAPWLDRPEIRKAFPGVIMAMFNTYAGMEDIRFDGGRPRLNFIVAHSHNPPFHDFAVDFTGFAMEERMESKRFSSDQR